jgi:dTDP-4-amino-4,6-dideoxygalactose transaminase
LRLKVAGVGIGLGASVVTTPFSFFASVSAILRAGATPVLALPIFPELREDEQNAVVEAIAEFLS